MQFRRACSTLAHPAALYPAEAQHAIFEQRFQVSLPWPFFPYCIPTCGFGQYVPNTEDMTLMQGRSRLPLGLRTRRILSGGRRMGF